MSPFKSRRKGESGHASSSEGTGSDTQQDISQSDASTTQQSSENSSSDEEKQAIAPHRRRKRKSHDMQPQSSMPRSCIALGLILVILACLGAWWFYRDKILHAASISASSGAPTSDTGLDPTSLPSSLPSSEMAAATTASSTPPTDSHSLSGSSASSGLDTSTRTIASVTIPGQVVKTAGATSTSVHHDGQLAPTFYGLPLVNSTAAMAS